MKKKIAVIMGYYNRKSLLVNTLNKFSQLYKDYNFEVIITDDKSNDDNIIDDIINNYNFKIILLKVLDKNWINPCVAYNLAITHISPDTEFVVIQNPEIYHLTNIFDIVLKYSQEGLYLTFPVLSSLNDKQTINYINIPYDELENKLLMTATRFQTHVGEWCNHPIYRLRNFHFLSVIHINDLKKIGGFDNEFKDGAWYDDNELLRRINKICKVNCLDTKINNNIILGLHQYHPILAKQNESLISKNKNLYNKLRSNMKKKDFNIYCEPKLDINYKIINNIDNLLN